MNPNNRPCNQRDELCDICNEFSETLESALTAFGWDCNTRILYKTEHTAIIPAMGSFIPNYLMLVPLRHTYSLRHLSHSEISDMEDCVKMLESRFGKGTFFEHGSIDESKHAGACLDHAHLHFLPLDIDIRKLTENTEYQELENFSSLTGIVGEYNYIRYIENNYYSNISELPKQYLRKVVTKYLGIPDFWDWRSHPFLDNMKATREAWRRFNE